MKKQENWEICGDLPFSRPIQREEVLFLLSTIPASLIKIMGSDSQDIMPHKDTNDAIAYDPEAGCCQN